MGRAEDLFQRIKFGGASEIQDMIDNADVEELFLDYKRASTTAPFKKLAPADKDNYAKAIAGFANSDGGVIVWGVDCRKTDEGDVPTNPFPIKSAKAFKTLLDGSITAMTLPPHSGVENLDIPLPGKSEGFVVSHIPVGFNVPYRAIGGNKDNYYIRAGSNFLPAPHGVLAGLFGKAPHPELELDVYRVILDTYFTDKLDLRVIMAVRNDGRGVAENLFVNAISDAHGNYEHIIGFNRGDWDCFQTKNGNISKMTGVYNKNIFHPGSILTSCVFRLVFSKQISRDVVFECSCGAKNCLGAQIEITLMSENLQRYMGRRPELSAVETRKALESDIINQMIIKK